MPRASSYTPEIGFAICEELAQGDKSLRQICRELKISHSSVLFWAQENKEFADQYTRAREIGDDLSFENLEDKAAEVPPTDESGRVDNGWVQWKRLQIDTMKWSLAKRRPKKYGDKLQVEGDLKVTRLVVTEPSAVNELPAPKPEFEE